MPQLVGAVLEAEGEQEEEHADLAGELDEVGADVEWGHAAFADVEAGEQVEGDGGDAEPPGEPGEDRQGEGDGTDLLKASGWTLDRAERALTALEARLRPTGSRLYRSGVNGYRLGPALSALSRHDQQRLRRRQSYRDNLAPEDAGVLHWIIRGWVDKQRWVDPADRAVVNRLLDAGLVHDKGDRYGESAEVRFSLRLDG